jgi:DNA-binding Lrp family transcriptional regulator
MKYLKCLDDNDYKIINIVKIGGPMSIANIARAAKLKDHQSTVGYKINRLTKLGYLETRTVSKYTIVSIGEVSI